MDGVYDEFLTLSDEQDGEAVREGAFVTSWQVLVVDDEADVLAVTRAVLGGCKFLGRPIELLEATSAAEARRQLEAHPDIALVLLDVVMETDDAGLRLVRVIREDLQRRALRILLRTGQPGRAPERQVIVQYDINDYRLKTELSAHALYTAVIAALRGYDEIAARIQAEQDALMAARAKAQFLASLSHELRTPLNAVIGFAEVMAHMSRQGSMDPVRCLDYVDAIGENGRQLLGLLNALLDMARIDSGHYVLREQEIDVGGLVRSCLAMTAEQAAAAGVTLIAEPLEGVAAVLGDPAALGQVLLNLLSNAVKFSPGGGTVRVAVRRGADDRPVLSVSDQGIGIPADKLGLIFRPFSQVDGGLARRFEGVGLGLSIVKGLVDLHGGSAEVDSTVGQGTTVTVRLPAARLLLTRAAAL